MIELLISLTAGLVGSLLVLVWPGQRKYQNQILVLVFSLISLVANWLLAGQIFRGQSPQLAVEIGPLLFSLQPDRLGSIFALIVASLWPFASLYSFGYMAKKPRLKTYYAFFLLTLSVTLAIAYSGSLPAFYLFYELLTLVTYPLVIQTRQPETRKAGKKYIIYSFSGAGLILLAMVMTASLNGQLNFIAGSLLAGGSSQNLSWILVLYLAGFGVKAAIMPLHRWLPAAMVAPTPISALLHAVAVVYSGVFGILRTVYSIFRPQLVQNLPISAYLPWLAAFTILAGVIIATRQDVLKRRLAYHTISQLSYILLGAFLLKPWALAGSLLHMISYSTLKMTLFFCAGVISEETGEVKISRMEGLGWQLPKTMVAFAVASLGMIGMLPLNTFWSKYYLMKGGISAGGWPFALSLIISGLINAVCFIPTVIIAFSGKRVPAKEGSRKIYLMLLPSLTLAGLALLLGFFPGLVWSGIMQVVQEMF